MSTNKGGKKDKGQGGDAKGGAEAEAPKGGEAVKLEVLAQTDDAVRVDASERLSYKEYAKLRAEPVVTVQRIIARKAGPEIKKREHWPNMEIKQVVIWGEIPKEPPPKPERAAATIKTYIMHVPPAPKPPPKGIGSMQPPGKG